MRTDGRPDPGRGARGRLRDRRPLPRLGAARAEVRAAVPLHLRLRREGPHRPARRLRLARRRHRRGAHRRGLRRGRLPPGHRERPHDPQPGPPRRHLRRARRPLRGHVRARGRRRTIVEALRESGRLFKAEEYEHSYPHCWRCDTPLIYYAKSSWYVRTTERKEELLAANEEVTWYPHHIKHGRFGNWLENNVDWALSRERYWGTPLPIWRSEDGEETICVGSREELARAGRRGARRPPPPLHRRRDLRARRQDLPPRARPDRRLVGLGLHAVRPGRRPGGSPRRLHLRGARPDPRLVLLDAHGLDAAVRPLLVRDLPLPRPDPRPRGPEDVEVQGQRGGALGRARGPRRGRLPLVLLHLEAAVGRLPLLGGDGRRVGAPVHEDAVEHLQPLRALRERERRRARRAAGWSSPTSTAGRSRACTPPPRR